MSDQTSPVTDEPVTPPPKPATEWKTGQAKLTPEQLDEARSLFLKGYKLSTIAKRFGVHPGSMKRHSSQGEWGKLKADVKAATIATIGAAQAKAVDTSHTISKAVTQFLEKSIAQADRLAARGLEHGETAPDPRSYGEAVRGWAVAVGQGRLALGLGERAEGGQGGGVTVNIGLLGDERLRPANVSAQSGRDNSAIIDVASVSDSGKAG